MVVQSVRRNDLREVENYQVLDGVHPIGGMVGATPAIFSLGSGYAGGPYVEYYREP